MQPRGPSQTDFRYRRGRLEAIFAPQSVALVGVREAPADEGRTLLANLASQASPRNCYVVDGAADSVEGVKAYPTLKSVGRSIDLVVIRSQPEMLPAVIADCVASQAKAALLMTGVFWDTDRQSHNLQEAILKEARRGRLPLLGPGSRGVINPHTGLNATTDKNTAIAGSVALVSQSGSLCTAILDWSLRENVGFSSFVSTGFMWDVGWGDIIDYLGDDPLTKSILLYMESVGDARSFLSAAREVALSKPIMVLQAAATGSRRGLIQGQMGDLFDTDEVLQAAFRRCGVCRVESLAELFYLAEVLSAQPRPKGPRLAIVTNARGPGNQAADALIKGGGQLASVTGTDPEVPGGSGRAKLENPIHVDTGGGSDAFARAVERAAADSGTDGVLAILVPSTGVDPTETANRLREIPRPRSRPLLASWMGGEAMMAGKRILAEVQIPVFPFPDTAARLFTHMWRYSYNLETLYEVPALPATEDAAVATRAEARRVIDATRQDGRTRLSTQETKSVLAAYGIPVGEPAEVSGSMAYEAVLASTIDTRFGPVLLFGLGGVASQIFRDYAVGLPPLNTTLARRLLELTRVWMALQGPAGAASDGLKRLEELLVRFSCLVVEQRWIRECIVDPLVITSSGRVLALEAGLTLNEVGAEEDLPQPAIRPYPAQYVRCWKLKDGSPVTLRPIRPEDEPLMVDFHRHLSDRSVYYRYFHMMKLSQRISHERLRRICFKDYDREIAIVVDNADPHRGRQAILGVGRLTKIRGTDHGEFALLVADQYQGQGMGGELLRHLIHVARCENLTRILGEILLDNAPMQRVCSRLGFRLVHDVDGHQVRAELNLI